jgi:phage FluMu protein Com
MKILRRSVEQLTSPICATCNIEMEWSRSALIAEGQAVLHVFICPRCQRISETKTPVKAPNE